jgi:hypothetical protein
MRGKSPGLARAAVALLALVSFGAGCTPAPKGVLAVERAEDGGVRLLLADCPGYLAGDFSVLADGTGGELVDWGVHNGGSPTSVRDVRVFQDPPQGWRVTGDRLTALRQGVPYVAEVSGSVGNRRLESRVPFTVGDLAAVKSGEVLTWAGGEKNVTVSRDAFLRGDPDRCTP